MEPRLWYFVVLVTHERRGRGSPPHAMYTVRPSRVSAPVVRASVSESGIPGAARVFCVVYFCWSRSDHHSSNHVPANPTAGSSGLRLHEPQTNLPPDFCAADRNSFLFMCDFFCWLDFRAPWQKCARPQPQSSSAGKCNTLHSPNLQRVTAERLKTRDEQMLCFDRRKCVPGHHRPQNLLVQRLQERAASMFLSKWKRSTGFLSNLRQIWASWTEKRQQATTKIGLISIQSELWRQFVSNWIQENGNHPLSNCWAECNRLHFLCSAKIKRQPAHLWTGNRTVCVVTTPHSTYEGDPQSPVRC